MNADILVVRGRISTLAREPVLSLSEHRRAVSLGRARDAFVAGRTLVRRVLGDLEITDVPDGKPHLTDPDIDFNVSHSGELVLVAVARGRRVGVDVEQISHRRDTTALAEALGPDAAFELQHTPVERRPARFSCWWVRIEALCKATGAGLTFPVDTAIPPGFAVRDIPMHAGYRAAVAFDGDPRVRLAIHDWSTP